MWNNNRLLLKIAALLLAVLPTVRAVAADPADHSPQLLLTAQRLRRLKRDRERQTPRWVSFENRVNSTPDSRERGFELALYYAITGDQARGKEAVQWALAHGCQRRQVALVLDWASALVAPADRSRLLAPNCPVSGAPNVATWRDAVFLKAAADQDLSSIVADSRKKITSLLAAEGFRDAATLYAASEYITAVRAVQRVDVREENTVFFLQLPVEFLLAMNPAQLDKPSWMTHVAALALVALDPNLESSQFLQGWAISDRQMIREGDGVAYELLWADPYLPGIGYQNMDRWVYDPSGRLFARMSWETDSCHIEISASGVKEENCPKGWRDAPATFGRLTLIPMTERCLELPHVPNGDALIVWKLKPNEGIRTERDKQRGQPQGNSTADAAGLWHVAANVEGKACTAGR